MPTDDLLNDCCILLDRVFMGAELVLFGEDGLGKHGRALQPIFCNVKSVFANNLTEDDGITTGHVRLSLTNYDSTVTGHAITDANLRISLNQLLQKHSISPASVDWGPIQLQGTESILLTFDADKLVNG